MFGKVPVTEAIGLLLFYRQSIIFIDIRYKSSPGCT
jgi:hypothetical protein